MKPSNPLYSLIPDHYAIRKFICNRIGHKYDYHVFIVDYTLEREHYLHCKRCFCIIKETENCVAETGEEDMEDLNWSKAKKTIHKNDKFAWV